MKPSAAVIVAPSLLACDFSRVADEVRRVEDAGAEWLHIDVMDGHFVPNLSMGPAVVEGIRRVTKLPLDVHLMIDDPQRHLRPFLELGSRTITPHIEAEGLRSQAAVERLVDAIHQAGARAGLALRPRTQAEAVKPFLPKLEQVLVMTVEPGFGGQAFIPEAVPKVRQLRAWFAGDICVDGGINAETGRLCREAGANILVAGTYVFKSPSCQAAIQSLRGGVHVH